MAIPLTPAQRAGLRRGAIGARALLDLYLGSGRYSFWDGDEHQDFNGQTYISAGAFATVSDISYGIDLGADGIEIVFDATRLLNASPDPFDPVKLLASITAESYHQRRAELRLVLFDIETREQILLTRSFTGVIDQMVIEEAPANSNGGASVLLVLKLESVARRYGRRVGRTRTHEDHQEIWPGDNFFQFVSSTVAKERQLYWGRMPPAGTVSGVSAGATVIRAPFLAERDYQAGL